MEEALRTLLLTDTALANLVGRLIDWDVIPQGKSGPAVVMHLISGVPDYHMAGPSGLVQSRVQIDCRATTKATAKAVARAVEAVLSGYKSKIGAITFGGIFKDNGRSRFDKTEPESFFTESADYLIWNGSAL